MNVQAGTGTPKAPRSAMNSGSEPSGDGRDASRMDDRNDEDASNDVDWTHTSKLAEEISKNLDSPVQDGKLDDGALEQANAGSETWPPGLKRLWPPEPSTDPFIGSANVHKAPLDDDEEVPFDESASVGVMHGDQIERKEFEKLQFEIDRLNRELDETKRLGNENFELAQRSQAELANFKRRSKQEIEEFRKRAIDNLLYDLLPVLDSLEKAVWSIPKGEEDLPIHDGIRRTLQLFLNTLGKYNVEAISTDGVPFNPEIHSPLHVEETEEYEDNTVIHVYQSAYLLAGKLVRPAMVKLSKKPETDADGDADVQNGDSETPESPDTESPSLQTDETTDG